MEVKDGKMFSAWVENPNKPPQLILFEVVQHNAPGSVDFGDVTLRVKRISTKQTPCKCCDTGGFVYDGRPKAKTSVNGDTKNG